MQTTQIHTCTYASYTNPIVIFQNELMVVSEYTYTCIWTLTRAPAHTTHHYKRMYVHTHTHTHTRTYTHAHKHTHIHARICTQRYTNPIIVTLLDVVEATILSYIRIFVFVCLHLYIRLYVCIYIFAQKYTHTPRSVSQGGLLQCLVVCCSDL